MRRSLRAFLKDESSGPTIALIAAVIAIHAFAMVHAMRLHKM
jgi:Flp pilus assembly pilin Flp